MLERSSQLMQRLLLISNSTCYGGGYLDHCAAELEAFFGGFGRVLFVPYALFDRQRYAEKTASRFRRMGLELDSLDEAADPIAAVEGAAGIYVGGGNTFRLLRSLYERHLLDPMRRVVRRGVPYAGTSAGSILPGPTIRTTNDMPIVEPPSLDALGLVPFNVNPHYLDADPSSTHMGETREERLREFLEENDRVVVGLREGGILRVDGERVELRGSAGARVFRRGADPLEAQPGDRLDFLLEAAEIA